jgi:hypothetical protein
MTMLSPDASGLAAQVRVLADLAQTLLAVSHQLFGDVSVGGVHGILLEWVGWMGEIGRARARSMLSESTADNSR